MGSDLINSQFSIPDSHPKERQFRQFPRMRIENWELRLGQIPWLPEGARINRMTKEEYFELAVNAFGDEKLDESIEHYKKALELDPKYQDALHGLGMALFNRGRIDEAIST